MASYQVNGVTNGVWGTANLGLIGTGTNANFAVLESISVTDPAGNPIEIEGRSGTTGIQVFLNNGFDATLKSVYQTNSTVTIPNKGETVLMVLPNGNFNVRIASSPIFDVAKKDLTRVTINVTYRPDVA